MQQETKRRKVVGTSQPEKQFVDGEADDDEFSGSKRKSAVTATSSSTDVSSTKANVAVETNNIVKNRCNLMKSLAVLEQSKPT